jgi:uncharacterized lipoprotein YmbA
MIRLFPALVLLLCSACIQLGGDPLPTQYYLLDSVATAEKTAQQSSQLLELSPIEFPNYLDRPQIVTRKRDNSILIAEHDRWAEPLAENIPRVLQENLLTLVPSIDISSAPWNDMNGQHYVLKLRIIRFDGIIDQQTEVDIRWSLYSPQQSKVLARQHFRSQTPITGGYHGLVTGLNQELAKLSKSIAEKFGN